MRHAPSDRRRPVPPLRRVRSPRPLPSRRPTTRARDRSRRDRERQHHSRLRPDHLQHLGRGRPHDHACDAAAGHHRRSRDPGLHAARLEREHERPGPAGQLRPSSRDRRDELGRGHRRRRAALQQPGAEVSSSMGSSSTAPRAPRSRSTAPRAAPSAATFSGPIRRDRPRIPTTYGVEIEGSTNIQVGGTLPAQRNVISGNAGSQIGFGCYFGGGSTTRSREISSGRTRREPVSLRAPGPVIRPASVSASSSQTSRSAAPSAGARNVISGNAFVGVTVSNAFAGFQVTDIVIRNNYLGTDVTGTLPLPNGVVAIRIHTGGNDVIDNVVSGNTGDGVYYGSGLPNDDGVVRGNKFGTDASGTQPLSNGGWGLHVLASGLTIGGTGAGEANVIAYNGTTNEGGIYIEGGTEQHDPRQRDPRQRRARSRHLSRSAPMPTTSSTAIRGRTTCRTSRSSAPSRTLRDAPEGGRACRASSTRKPSTTYALDVFANDACVRFPKDFLEGKRFLGSGQVTTDGFGEGSSTSVPLTTQPGERVSLTATGPGWQHFRVLPAAALLDQSRLGPGGRRHRRDDRRHRLRGRGDGHDRRPARGQRRHRQLQPDHGGVACARGGLAQRHRRHEHGGDHRDAREGLRLRLPRRLAGESVLLHVTQLVTNAITAGIGGGLYGWTSPRYASRWPCSS